MTTRISYSPIIKILVVVFFIFNFLETNAQNDTIQNFYRDSTGKLFIANGAHIYLYLGISPDASKSIRLKGDNGDNPIHWSGHGLKHLTHLNLFLGRKVSLDLFSDALPPKTSIGFDGKKSFQKENTIYLSGMGVIEMSAVDKDAGLKGICYSINSGANIKYLEPITLKSEGQYKLSVFAFDNVGNKEEEATRTIYIDNTPPLSHIEFEGDKFENIVSGRTALSISSVDALGVKETLVSIDSSKFLKYERPIITSNLSEGEHTIKWYSVDEVENVEEVKSATIYVDKTPPMVFEEIVGNTYIIAGKEFSSGRNQLKIAAVDNKAGVKEIKYSLNNGEFKTYTKPVYLSDIMGVVSVKSFALDNVGNRSNSDSQTESFTLPTVDITGPQINYSFKGPKIQIRDTFWIGPKSKIVLSANDIGAGLNRITYKVQGGDEANYIQPFSLEKFGKHNLLCTAYDNVENINFINFSVGLDDQAPSIYFHFSNEPIDWLNENGEKIPVYSKGLILYLGATDNISGVDKLTYRINEGKESQYNSPIDWFMPKKTYIFQIKSVDVLGNSSEKIIKFRVE